MGEASSYGLVERATPNDNYHRGEPLGARFPNDVSFGGNFLLLLDDVSECST